IHRGGRPSVIRSLCGFNCNRVAVVDVVVIIFGRLDQAHTAQHIVSRGRHRDRLFDQLWSWLFERPWWGANGNQKQSMSTCRQAHRAAQAGEDLQRPMAHERHLRNTNWRGIRLCFPEVLGQAIKRIGPAQPYGGTTQRGTHQGPGLL
ncbi:MAG: hypothetical protein ACRC56_12950, partial [Bosea sp. (in: a-proteobacteria)]